MPFRRLLLAAAALQLLPAGLWGLSRTVGLPFGPAPWQPWNVGMADLICTFLEVATAIALIAVSIRRHRLRPRRRLLWSPALPPTLLLILALVLYAKLTAGVEVAAPALGGLRPAPGRMTTFTGGARLPMDLYEPHPGAARPAPWRSSCGERR